MHADTYLMVLRVDYSTRSSHNALYREGHSPKSLEITAMTHCFLAQERRLPFVWSSLPQMSHIGLQSTNALNLPRNLSSLMLGRLFRKTQNRRPPALRDGLRVYAVGDIHGRSDLLSALHRRILTDAAGHTGEKEIIYLGDYVDRGLDTQGVLDLLINEPLPGFRSTHLMGNHEQALLEFLSNTEICQSWLTFGGSATLQSYGVHFDVMQPSEDDFQALQQALTQRLPPDHLAFLKALQPYRQIDGYLFVHAGIRPGVALENQTVADLFWIRGDFLSSAKDHGQIVVHGHSVAFKPEFKDNRIGIDTGAYATGVLSCLVLEGDDRRVIHT